MGVELWSGAGDESISPPPKIRPLDGLTGVEVVDRIEGSRGVLLTDTDPDISASPTAADSDGPFCFPVTAAVSLDATTIRTPYRQDIYVRDEGANVAGMATDSEPVTLPRGRYTIELPSFPTKVYIAVHAAVEAVPEEQSTRISLREAEYVYVGTRSHHRQPARSVEIPKTPAGVRRAVSVFGSTLKTYSPERSFSTLRGHPPSIVWADEQSATDPDPAVPSETAPATIRVPDDYASVFAVAPLAYYLDANVESTLGDSELVVGGTTYPLGTGDSDAPLAFEAPTLSASAHRVFRHLFTLDCVVRTVGFYQVPLQAHLRLRDRLDIDRQALYDAGLPERTQAYLSLPHAPVAEVAPQWALTTDMTPTAEEARALPYLAARLARIRVHEDPLPHVAGSPSPRSSPGSPSAGSTAAGASGTGGSSHEAGGSIGDSVAPSDTGETTAPPVELPDTDSQQHVWTGTGVAAEATTTRPADFARSVERRPDDLPEQVTVDVVCTDERMEDETIVRELYGNRQLLEYEVRHHDKATKETVRDVLQGDANLFHYIGHAEPGGLVCDDGMLKPAEVSEIGPELAVLNGCESERVARAFADRGLLAALATTERVQDTPAARLGTALARLLNGGWPVNAAFSFLSRVSPDTGKYAVIGDGTISLVQHGDGVPTAFTIWRDEMEYAAQVPSALRCPDPPSVPPGKVGVMVETFATPTFGPGGFYTSYLDDIEARSLTGGFGGYAVLSPEEVYDEIGDTAYPVFIDRQLHWACDLVPGERPLLGE